MEEALRFGLMAAFMKAIGNLTKPMVEEDLFILMVITIMDNGLMIKLMDSVFISIKMETNTKVIGRKTNNMVME